jgi:hypothetical protein
LGGCVSIETTIVDEQVDITDAKGSRILIVCVGIFAGVEQEEET